MTQEQLAFKAEVAAFLDEALPPGLFIEEGRQTRGQEVLLNSFLEKIAERRWLTLGWPLEYGGGGRGNVDQAIFNEQMGYHQAPYEAMVNVTVIGPAILHFGSEDQKKEHLSRISSGKGVYWQAFTEPDSGSDLASLKTRAVRDGDDFVVNGQKIYVGDGRQADYFYLAARTDTELARHRGISIFLVDARTPGVTVSKVDAVAGWAKNQIFFDDARIPASALMGQLNNGWSHMRDTLSVERSGVFHSGDIRKTLENLIAACKVLTRNGKPIISYEWARSILADLTIEVDAWNLLCWRIVELQSKGLPINDKASIAAVQRKDFFPRFQENMYRLIGSHALIHRSAQGAVAHGEFEYWQRHAMQTHSGGTPEIQRNIIALRGLGLPK